MINTQRLILIVLTVNLIIGISQSAYANITTYSADYIRNELQLYESYEQQFTDDDIIYGGLKNKETLTDPTIGSSLNWGKILLDVFVYGINPFSINSNMFETYIEQMFADLLMTFRLFMWVLLGVEGYFVIKNKKTN